MEKRMIYRLITTGIFLIIGIQVGIKQSWAEGVYSYVEAEWHSDYHDDREPIRVIAEEESYALNALVDLEEDGDMVNGSYEVEARVITNFGMHQAYTRSKTIDGNKEVVSTYAYSQFEDDWIVRAPTDGELHFGVTLFGNYEGENNGLGYDVDCEGDGCDYIIVDPGSIDLDTFGGTQLVKVTIGYHPDKFFTVRSMLGIDSYSGNYEEGITDESHIDFGHSAVITSLDLPPGATLETASGTVYPLDYTPPGDNQVGSGGGGGGGGGIFGDILKSSVIGYHLDGWTPDGVEVYMPVTKGFKALKGAQEYVRSFAPNLAEFVREFFDSLEKRADANKDSILYQVGTHIFPVLGKIAEKTLGWIGQEEYIDNAYSKTTISVEKFKQLEQAGVAIAPKSVKGTGRVTQELSLIEVFN